MHPPAAGAPPEHWHTIGDTTTFAGVRRDLNVRTLRVTVWLSPLVAGGHLTAYFLTRRPPFLLLAALGTVLGVTSVHHLRTGNHNAEPVLSAGALSVLLLWPLTGGTVRGGLTAGLVILAMVGYLVLPERARVRAVIVIGTILLGQLLWVLAGVGEIQEVGVHLILSLVYLAIGLFAMGVARRTLEESERSRLGIFRRVPIGLIRVSRSGALLEVNPAFAGILGFEVQRLVGRPLAAFHEDTKTLVRLAAELESATEPRRFANRVLRHDGTAIWVRGLAQAIRDESGSILYYEATVEDVTQRRELEERSRVNAERFRNVFERAPIAIWEEDWSGVADALDELRVGGVEDLSAHLHSHPDEVLRLQARVRYLDVNPAGIAQVGASSREDAIANVPPDPFPSPGATSFVKEFIGIWEDHDHSTFEAAGRRIDGEPLDLRVSWAAGRDAEGLLDLSHVIVALVDITEEKRGQRHLATLAASKDEFVASISHELRTPITTIMGMALELRDNAASFSSEESHELIGIIADQSRELSNIVEDLLVAARADLGVIVVQPEEVNVRNEIEQILAAGDAAAAPIVEIPDGVVAWADSLRFRQIVRNLLSNARRYGGPTVLIGATIEGDDVVLTVSDDGKGVPTGDEESIFVPYLRSRRDPALPSSIGLGLPVSRHLAQLMGGELTYRYEQGSVFELRLPGTNEATAAA